MFKIIDGDIFDSTEDYLCHQCNCVTTGAAHMAAAVFKKFPEADIYTFRDKPDAPGTAIIRGKIVNLLGQYYPSFPKYPDSKEDGFEARIDYFRQSLWDLITKVPPSSSFAFPWRIGCGAAGGDWGRYIEILKDFEGFINKRNPKANVTIYKLPRSIS